MKKKTKFLSILTAIAVAMSLSACRAEDTGQAPPLIESVTTVVEEAAETVEMKTIEPPEDGWTVEELLSVTYVYGQQLESPCTLNTLGDDFSFDLSTFTFLEEDNLAVIMLKYQNTIISTINLNNCKSQEEVCNTTEINGYMFNLLFENNNANNIYINGINFYSTQEQVIKRLGKPDAIEKASETTYIAYNNANTNDVLLAMNFNSDNELTSFRISY